ncbi:hypothetical protein AHF37_03447 [Paragonimus kellicotti]|nr:hypothetical protein AHF37_03447 [Paragonimus kellicotti]
MKDAQRRQKEQYDQHVSDPVYPVGCRVWLHRPETGVREPAKPHRRWHGQCEGVIRDPQSTSSDVLTMHYNQLKPASSTSYCEPCDINMSPGCIPIDKRTVEISSEGGSASALTKEGTEDSVRAEEGTA